MSSQDARRDGYYAGYNQALNEKAYDPKPKLIATITDQNYLKSFLTAYDQGFSQAQSDRALLLGKRHENYQLNNDAPERLI